jgi:protein-export membrane protein SecD
MTNHFRWLVVIILLAAFSFWVSLPGTEGFALDLNNDGEPDISLTVQQSLGLDLVGGLRVLLEAELPPDAFTIGDLRETANAVSRRVNALGLAEATVQVQGANRVLVELPGVTDPQQAIDTIQQTALLEFVDFGGLPGREVDNLVGRRILTTQQVEIDEQRAATAATQGEELEVIPGEEVERLRNPVTGEPFQTVMTGGGLQAAAAEFDGMQWLIRFDLTHEGGEVFGPFTGARIGQPLAIVLDGEVLSAPTIQARLDTGGVITGQFNEDEARQLALQLRSGSLRIPLRVESAEQVGATLGQESVEQSIRAGVVGVIIVLLFMATYYRVPGITADMALLIFIAMNMALYKLIPITLTLPAITGFLISIGTAVDGNVLIFERLKEELRSGKNLREALDTGFDRAWNSIRDSNISTILICGVLFLFGQTPGASVVSGFAITLALGLTLNLFTAVLVTRTFLYLMVEYLEAPMFRRKWLLGV